MKRKAVEAAEERCEQAREAATQLLSSRLLSKKEARHAWWLFVLAANGVYAKLEQGAKVSGSSRSWFSQKKDERKTDELLLYVHKARNSDEHSIDGSSEYEEMKIQAIGRSVKKAIAADGKETFTAMAGDKIQFKAILPGLRLLEIHDRQGRYVPPKQHKGVPLKDGSPQEVVALMMCYLEDMIVDARNLVSD